MKKTNHILLTFALLALLAGLAIALSSCGADQNATAPQINVLDMYYTFTLQEDDTYAIAANDASKLPTYLTIPDTYQDKPVTSISAGGFVAGEFASLTIGDNIKDIGWSAFSGCKNLTTVTLSGAKTIGDNAFQGCERLASVVIPEGVTSVGKNTFGGCYGLVSVTLPSSLTSIGEGAFSACVKLVEVINYSALPIEKGSEAHGRVAYNVMYLHQGQSKIDTLEQYLFIQSPEGKDFLLGYIGQNEDITLPSQYRQSTYSLYPYAFVYSHITSVAMPFGVESIAQSAFSLCPALISVTMGESVRYIEDRAFEGCSGLQTVCIGSGVEHIGKNPFYHCIMLKDIFVDEANQHYQSIDGNLYSKQGALTLLQYAVGDDVASYIIPEDVVGIADYAFADAKRLSSVSIPSSVESIGAYAFKSCSKLSYINIPDTVTTLGEGAFMGCEELSTVEVGEGITRIEASTFSGCARLLDLTLSRNVTYIGENAFANIRFWSELTFEGEIAEWQAIEKHSDWNKNSAKVTILCSDSSVEAN